MLLQGLADHLGGQPCLEVLVLLHEFLLGRDFLVLGGQAFRKAAAQGIFPQFGLVFLGFDLHQVILDLRVLFGRDLGNGLVNAELLFLFTGSQGILQHGQFGILLFHFPGQDGPALFLGQGNLRLQLPDLPVQFPDQVGRFLFLLRGGFPDSCGLFRFRMGKLFLQQADFCAEPGDFLLPDRKLLRQFPGTVGAVFLQRTFLFSPGVFQLLFQRIDFRLARIELLPGLIGHLLPDQVDPGLQGCLQFLLTAGQFLVERMIPDLADN